MNFLTCILQALSKTKKQINLREASDLLIELIPSTSHIEIALYNLSTIFYELGDYELARFYAEELLRLCPDNGTYQDLHSAVVYKHDVDVRTKRIVGGVGVALGIGLLGMAVSIIGKRK